MKVSEIDEVRVNVEVCLLAWSYIVEFVFN